MDRFVTSSNDVNKSRIIYCVCPMNVVDPAFRDDLERFCERCGHVIDFDKFEAYKRSQGLSGYDEDYHGDDDWESNDE